MPRDRRHFILNNLASSLQFRSKLRGSAKHPSDVVNRAGHAQALLQALDHLPALGELDLPGVYLEIVGRTGEPMITSGLNASGLKLLRFEEARAAANEPARATVFTTERGLDQLRRKIADFVDKDTEKGRPRNADLVQSIAAIVEAGLRALWRSPMHRFPADEGVVPWEVWLDPSHAGTFIATAPEFGVAIGSDRIEFPEDVVVIATATREALAVAVRRLAGVRALASPTVTADYFDDLNIEEQDGWVEDIVGRTTFDQPEDPNYVTLLDRGVSLAHPLIAPALAAADRHAANPAWGVEDFVGHGTQLSGLVLYGDMTSVLQSGQPIQVRHRLESAKIIPDAGQNPHHLLGAVTRAAINASEASGQRRRTFLLASTTEDDTPHDGAPTSWSSELDQLSAGVSGLVNSPRLLVVSAGNSDQNRFGNGNYLPICDHPDNELESPAQAWNPICVGAYTEKNVLPPHTPGAPLAPFGDLAPSSRTASWSSHWPLKPDVVMEGGNWIVEGMPPPLKHPALSMLTTDHQYPLRAFTTVGETSGATALAARQITELWSDYPDLWPETVRALFVSSARWTDQMRSHLPMNPAKGDYGRLLRRYGFGVPDLVRARRSASNALTLVVQDTIIPYRPSETKGADHVHNEMRLFALPWPGEALRRLVAHPVSLRVALSTFIAPNPSEPSRGSKFRYASHNLRFKLNRPSEDANAFVARISQVDDDLSPAGIEENDGWTFGSNRRDVGSLQLDELTCPASDLALRNLIAVHPVAGWWKMKGIAAPRERTVRFALIVEIDAGDVDVDLYAEVQASVEAAALVQVVV